MKNTLALAIFVLLSAVLCFGQATEQVGTLNATTVNATTVTGITGATINTPTFTGSAQFNQGGTASGATNLTDYVDQTTGNIFRTSMSGASYVGVWDPVVEFGWNANTGGGVISNSFPALWQQMEGNYCLNGTAPANCTTEWHNIVQGVNAGTYTRWMSCQWNAATAISNFCNFLLDLGMQWGFGTGGDGTPVTSVTAAWTSANGGTFTYTKPAGNWAYDYIAGRASVKTSGCTPSAYNFSTAQLIAAGGNGTTTFTITGVGANPGSSATGCTVQGGVGYYYASISSPYNGNANAFTTNGPMAINSGGILSENTGANANAGFILKSESGQFGGATNDPVFHAGGTSGITPGTTTCSTSGIFQVTGTGADEYFYCDGAHYQAPGAINLAKFGLNNAGFIKNTGSDTLAGDIFDIYGANGGMMFTSSYTDNANHAGFAISANAGTSTIYGLGFNTGSPAASLSHVLFGGQSGVDFAVRSGGSESFLCSSSTQICNFDQVLSQGGTSGVTAGSFSAITAIQTKGGLVTTLTGTSDRRLKTKIKPFPRGLEAIMQLHPALYHWNKSGQKITGFPAGLEQAGFIAQDVQKAIPEAVGTEPHDGVDYLNLNDRPILAALVRAVQEQQAEIEQLKAQIAQQTH